MTTTPHSAVWDALRFDAVADKLYHQHMQIHNGHYFPLEAVLDTNVEEEVYEVVEELERVYWDPPTYYLS